MPGLLANIDKIADNIKNTRLIRQSGVVESVVGLVIEATGPSTRVGDSSRHPPGVMEESGSTLKLNLSLFFLKIISIFSLAVS